MAARCTSLSPALAGALALLCACAGDAGSAAPTLRIHVGGPAETASVLSLAAQDLADVFSLYGEGAAVQRGAGPAACRDGEQHIVVLPPQLGGAPLPVADPQQFRVAETRCGAGRLVLIRGGALPAAQWGVYWLAEELGVRYLHPEQTLYPDALRWPEAPLQTDQSPSFRERAFHANRDVPFELLPPLDDPGIDMEGVQSRWVRWNVARRQTAVDGIDGQYVGNLPWDRGMDRWATLRIAGVGSGARAAIDADDPRGEEDQLAELIDAVLAPGQAGPAASRLLLRYDGYGLPPADEEATVQRLEFIAEYVSQRFPGVEVHAVNEGGAQPNGPVYGVRPWDLPALAQPVLGVSVRPGMPFDMERAAPVLGHAGFGFLADFIADQRQIRRIGYMPHTSWWRTFDSAIPLYLAPFVLDSRQHDLELLTPWLATTDAAENGVVSHEVVTNGQEWGYWLADLCSAQMAWDVSLGWEECVAWAFAGFRGRDVLVRVLAEVADRQALDLRDAAILSMFVGADPGVETARQIGVELHPLPPRAAGVLDWGDAEASAFEERSLTPLPAIASDYNAWADEIDALIGAARPGEVPWLRELRDGLRVMALRAEHSFAIYSGLLAARAAGVGRDTAALVAAADWAEVAGQVQAEVAEVVGRREADYRYPETLSTAGDEAGTDGAIGNGTPFPYRVLSRTRRLAYWVWPLEQLESALEALGGVQVNGRIVPLGQAVAPYLLRSDVSEVSVEWGDGATADTLAPHTFGAQGWYPWSVSAGLGDATLVHDDETAVVERRLVFARGALRVVDPAGGVQLEGVLPGFVVGLGTDDSGEFLALGWLKGRGTIAARGLVRLSRNGGQTQPADLTLPLGEAGSLTLYGAELSIDETEAGMPTLSIAGELATDDVIDALARLAGLERQSARDALALVLGLTSMTLPARVPLLMAADGVERGLGPSPSP